jgi:formylglycine-generating enzyme required for sulfatase activity
MGVVLGLDGRIFGYWTDRSERADIWHTPFSSREFFLLYYEDYCRVDNRNFINPVNRYSYYGFRCVQD